MSSVEKFGKKSERQAGEYTKKIGLAEWEVVAFNPNRERLTELLGQEPEKDPEYLGEKDGNATLRVSIWLKEAGNSHLTNASIFLEDKIAISKEREDDPTYKQTTQYINSRGKTRYTVKESELTEGFTKYPYHKARVGEAELTSFLDAYLDIDRSQDYSLTLDWAKLMKGNIRELEDLQKSDLPRTVCQMATVRTVEKEGEKKEYQSMYTKRWLPGWMMKQFKVNNYTPEKVEALRRKNEDIKLKNKNPELKKKIYLKDWEYYILDVADKLYGVKDVYTLQGLQDYNPADHMTGGNAVSTVGAASADDADY